MARTVRVLAPTLLALFVASASAAAQSLALRRWDVGDGLAHSRVNCVQQDARGFLWIGTWEGLSRFDGRRFTSYGPADGLGTQLVNCVREDPEGRLWVGTNGAGIARLVEDPAASTRPAFERKAVGGSRDSENVDEIVCGADGTQWLVTDEGLFVRRADQAGASERIEAGQPWNLNAMRPSCTDAQGRRWFGIGHTLVCLAENETRRFPLPADAPSAVAALHQDARGRLLAAFRTRLYEIRVRTADASAVDWIPIELPLAAGQELRCFASDRRGRLWIGTSKGLVREEDGRFTTFTATHGLPDEFVRALLCDRDGNLWIGTNSAGLLRLGEDALVSWTRQQGLPEDNVVHVVESASGAILASTWRSGIVAIEAERARVLPGSQSSPFDHNGLRWMQDHGGTWWFATDAGLFRCSGALPELEHCERFGAAFQDDGAACSLYTDPTGRVWIGTLDERLLVCEAGGAPREIARDLPGPASRLLLDSHGTLWIDARHQLGRWRDGKLDYLARSPGLPELDARAFHEDARGRLWIGLRTGGVSVTDDPTLAQPVFRNTSTRDGLASDTVWAIEHDRQGRIYLGTGRGLDRIDPETGALRHMGSADGLAGSQVNDLVRDRAGDLWIASTGGLSRLTPRDEERAPARQEVFLERLEVAGTPVALPERGAREFALAPLAAGASPLRIEWMSPCFRPGVEPRFQYRLAGGDAAWSTPSVERSVSFASLGSGAYSFEVRALGEDGVSVADAARLRFELLPPLWQRGWFLAACALLLGALAYALHRARVQRLLALETLRRQIAADVHDDVGAGLAQIAILTEVARRETQGQTRSQLEEVARLARVLRESMSDIVWAIDPRHDNLLDLVRRVRQVAYNLFSAGERFELVVPRDEELERTPLAPDLRRQLLLASKELLSNAARHAQASHVRMQLELEPRALVLRVEDDGHGFDPSLQHAGHGLHGLRRRAHALAGTLELSSAPGQGTQVSLRIPLARAG